MNLNTDRNERPEPDSVLVKIADYVCETDINSELAYETAQLCLRDSLGCAALAMNFPECRKLLGPVVSGTQVPNGSRVLGTQFCLDPIKAAWDIGCLIRWLDFNDTWLASEWGHPSDNLGAILSVADYVNRAENSKLTVRDILTYMIKAYEIQGVLALENSFNAVGLDHVVLVKIASTAVATHMLGGNKEQVISALSQAWVDGQSLRTYRHAPNTGSRKSWAAGDASARGTQLAMLTMKGEIGYPSALSATQWGFYDVLFDGKAFEFNQNFDSYVMENILFKISYPAEFHAQTAVECAIKLHPQIIDKLNQIERIELTTQSSAIRIISKQGPLDNSADRDHCLQYMVAIGLLKGDLDAKDYSDESARDPRIDTLRQKMDVIEDPRYSADYLDSEKRSIANAVQIFFNDGTQTDKIEVEYPLGHKRRREQGVPILLEKFNKNLASHYPTQQVQDILKCFNQQENLWDLPADEFLSHFIL